MTVDQDANDHWHAQRLAGLRAPDGWLTLAGRWDLSDGPAETPLGTFTLDGTRVHLAPIDDRPLTRPDGRPLRDGMLDAARDRLLDGARTWEVLTTGGTVIVRVRDPEAPDLPRLVDLPRWSFDPRWQIPAVLVADAREADLSYASGARVARPSPGHLRVQVQGVRYDLECTFDRADVLLVEFADPTNGDGSYAAGRFLYVDWTPDALVLDFNRAINPPCALTPHALCPLVPASNRLIARVEAGEREPVWAEGPP